MELDLQGKVALVTGGASGIGRSIAEVFARLGAAVVVADIELKAAEEVALALQTAGRPALAVEVDVQDAGAIDVMLAQTLERFGTVDVLVNAAGVGAESPIVEMSEEEWDWVLGVNLKGTFLCTRAITRWWVENRLRGKIINLSALDENRPVAGQAHCCASNGALLALTRAAALELAPHGIHVNALTPGLIEAPLAEQDRLIPEPRRTVPQQLPFGRLGSVEDVAKAAAFLASDWSDWVTGHTIAVDGGAHLMGQRSAPDPATRLEG